MAEAFATIERVELKVKAISQINLALVLNLGKPPSVVGFQVPPNADKS